MDYIEVQISLQPREPWADILASELSNIGFDSFLDTRTGINAYIPADAFNEESFRAVMDMFTHSFTWSFHLTRLQSQNWNEIWEKAFEPVHIGNKLVVRAPFHPAPGNNPEHEIVIEPKMSFGTGHHETTWMMLNAMLELELYKLSVADVGCGSGILAILAEKKGAGKVMAVDTEDDAVRNTLENLRINNCGRVIVEKGSTERLSGMDIDVILANINRNTLLAHMKPFADCLVDGGRLLISGFFETDVPVLRKEAESAGFVYQQTQTRKSWAMLEFKMRK